MKTKAPLSYFGSDSQYASQLGSLLDNCKHVTIPFCGGLSILPFIKASHIVANDANNLVINFYRVLAGTLGMEAQLKLIARCSNTLSHPEEMAAAQQCLEMSVDAKGWVLLDDCLDAAWGYWAMCWIGRKGKGGTKQIGGMPSLRRTANGGGNASRLCAAAADLEEWARLFRKCEFESLDFRDQLPKVADEPGCGLYVDAPWFGAGKHYQVNFTDDCHRDLAALLHRFVHATIVIRYDANHLTRFHYNESDWRYREIVSRTQANTNINEVWITRRAA